MRSVSRSLSLVIFSAFLTAFCRDFADLKGHISSRIGRLLLFKDCLKYNIVPFIIDEELKLFYYRGLKEWESERGYLRDTCLTAQDKFKLYLDYFKISRE